MAFTMKQAILGAQEAQKDEFLMPQENFHLFDNFMEQFQKACQISNNTSENIVELRYYLMNEILMFQVLKDANIPLIDFEKSNHEVFYFDPELSFEAPKDFCFNWSFELSPLFKYLIENKKLHYYKNRETTLDDLLQKIQYSEEMFAY